MNEPINNKAKWLSPAWLAVILGALAIAATAFQSKEGEVTIVARFGDMNRVITEPGLHFRLPPPIDTLHRVDMRVHHLDPPMAEFLTNDRRNLEVDAFVAWRVSDPKQFLLSQGSRESAEVGLADFLKSSLVTVLTETRLDEILYVEDASSANEAGDGTQRGFAKLAERATKLVSQDCVDNGYGIEILYVGVERLTFHRDNLPGIISQMREERKGEEGRIRDETREEVARIVREGATEQARIESEADREAAEIEGRSIAAVQAIEAEMRAINPELYELQAEIAALEAFLESNGTLLLGEDHFLLNALKLRPAGAKGPHASESSKEGQ